jgi:predicted DCC family thiol-disulfide oxidoreductase YuxK
MGWFKRHFLGIDPRTLALTRVLMAGLLLVDLAKRWVDIELWYDEHGLVPTSVAATTGRGHKLSIFFMASRWEEAAVLFALCAVCYLCLLFGYRTRLAQIGALIASVSHHTRTDLLCNGGDFVLDILCWWTVFLPLGRCFSLDALLASLRARVEHTAEAVIETRDAVRDHAPAVSLAVLAALLQLSVIYFFNAISKSGPTWERGEAIYYLAYQERLLAPLGLWARHHLPFAVMQALSYGALLVEISLPLLILSPFGKPYTRRLAVLFVIGLHVGIQLIGNFGVFSFVMMVFSSLLIEGSDWDRLARWARARPGRARRVYFDGECGVCFQTVRVLARLDVFGRLTPQPNRDRTGLPEGFDPSALEQSVVVVDPASGRVYSGVAALCECVRALPCGGLVAWLPLVPGVRAICEALYRKLADNRAQVSVAIGYAACGLPGAAGPALELHEPAPLAALLARPLAALRELSVAYLMVVATGQVLVENPSLRRLDVTLPPSMIAAVSYTRLQQGWRMFAPDAPMGEMSLVVDALTSEGRHVDPLNELAARTADPLSRRVPVRPDYDVFWVDYLARLEGARAYHPAFRQWILAYPERTGRPQDRIVWFELLKVSQDSPVPGQREPRNLHADRVLQHGRQPRPARAQ